MPKEDFCIKESSKRKKHKLSNNWFSKNYDSIVLKTTNGVVTITGNVDKVDDVQKIVDEIRTIDGVRSIDNQLTLKR